MSLAYIVIAVISIIFFSVINWQTGNFNFFTIQDFKFYFQSWISIATILFAITMSITMFILYKKNKSPSLKYISLVFVFIALAYSVIGYHAAYCEMCSNLTLCSASHNYPNYLIIAAITIFIAMTLLLDIKSLKMFAFALIGGSFLLISTLFFSINYMETPSLIPYEIGTFNLQGFVFFVPLLPIIGMFVYFKTIHQLSLTVSILLLLSASSFIPQAFHIFFCKECHNLECSEFYILSGVMMTIVTGLFMHSLRLHIKEKNHPNT